MATRFYFPASQAALITPPAASGTDWEHINGVTRLLSIAPDASALASTAYTPDAADDLTDRDSCHRQYVSDPLRAQTIAGNIKGQFQCLEANANNNLFITLKVLVCNNDGSATQATLRAITRATSLEVGTALANRTFPSSALSSFGCADGDRLVVEVGLGGLCTAAAGTQGHNGSIRWGGSASSGDLPIDETTTTTTFRPWIEFDSDLLWFGQLAIAPVEMLRQHGGYVGRRIR